MTRMKKLFFSLSLTLLVANSFASDTVHYDIRKDTKPISKPNHPIVGTDTTSIKPNLPSSN